MKVEFSINLYRSSELTVISRLNCAPTAPACHIAVPTPINPELFALVTASDGLSSSTSRARAHLVDVPQETP